MNGPASNTHCIESAIGCPTGRVPKDNTICATYQRAHTMAQATGVGLLNNLDPSKLIGSLSSMFTTGNTNADGTDPNPATLPPTYAERIREMHGCEDDVPDHVHPKDLARIVSVCILFLNELRILLNTVYPQLVDMVDTATEFLRSGIIDDRCVVGGIYRLCGPHLADIRRRDREALLGSSGLLGWLSDGHIQTLRQAWDHPSLTDDNRALVWQWVENVVRRCVRLCDPESRCDGGPVAADTGATPVIMETSVKRARVA